MEIIEYNNKYREQTINLLIDVAVIEYGFSEWKDEILSFKNEFFKNNGGNCWIAIENNTVVGTISLRKIDDNSAEVKNLYIRKDKRGASTLGQDLLNTLVNYAKQIGYSRLQLDALKKFERSIRFYEKNGFYLIKAASTHSIYEKKI